jgi:hypothetical protein
MNPVAAVELDPLLETAGWALAFGVGVPLVFACGVRAFIAMGESRTSGRPLAATLAGAIGVACVLAGALAVVIGLAAVSDG